MNGSYLLIATAFSCAVLAGVVFALPVSVAASLGNYLHLAEGRARVLRSWLLVLLVPMMLVSGLLIDYRLGLLALLMLLAYPLEAALAGWTWRYVVERGYLPGSTVVLSGGFWLAFLTSRLATALLLPPGCEAVLVAVLGLVAGIIL